MLSSTALSNHRERTRFPLSRVIGLTLKLWAGLALLCAVLLSLARTQPPAPFIPHLNTCGQHICYLGITPSRTYWRDAKAYLSEIPTIAISSDGTVRNLPDFSGTALISGSGVTINDMMVVDEIDLMPMSDSLSVGAAVLQWGAPCFLVPFDDMLVLIYPGMSLLVRAQRQGKTQTLRVMSPVFQANLFQHGQLCQNMDVAADAYRWHGFARYS